MNASSRFFEDLRNVKSLMIVSLNVSGIIFFVLFIVKDRFTLNLGAYKLTNHLNLIIKHFLGQPGVGSEEDRGVHDGVGSGECGGDASIVDFRKGCAVGTNQTNGLGTVFAHLHENGLPEEIAAEEHPVADLFIIQVVSQSAMGEGRGGLDADHEAEP